jgi:hypothetical protein
MTAPAMLRRGSFAVLDQLILDALGELRAARRVAARSRSHKNLELQARAEEHLNALLDYRLAAQRR